jgi:hypothetical protein
MIMFLKLNDEYGIVQPLYNVTLYNMNWPWVCSYCFDNTVHLIKYLLFDFKKEEESVA